MRSAKNTSKSKLVKEFKPHNVVAQDNILIYSRYKLNPREQRLILSLISEIKKTDKNLPVLKLNIDYLLDHLCLKGKDAFKSLTQITDRVLKKTLKINDKTKDSEYHELQTPWFASTEYFKSKNMVEFRFGEALVPYLLGLAGNFTSFQLKNLLNLKNKYSFKLYMVLRRWLPSTKNTVDFTLEEIKKLMQIERKKTYKEIYDIKRRILLPAKEEINKYTDIKIEIELIENKNRYVGRSPIGKVRIHIQENPNYIPATPPSKELPFSEDEKAAFKRSPLQKLSYDIQQQENLIRNLEGKVLSDELNLQKLKLEQLKLERDELKQRLPSTN